MAGQVKRLGPRCFYRAAKLFLKEILLSAIIAPSLGTDVVTPHGTYPLQIHITFKSRLTYSDHIDVALAKYRRL